jgi:hypothetical protein
VADAIAAGKAKDIGSRGSRDNIREVQGTQDDAQSVFNELAGSGQLLESPNYPRALVRRPDGTTVGYRPESKSGPPTIDVNYPDKKGNIKIKFTGEPLDPNIV